MRVRILEPFLMCAHLRESFRLSAHVDGRAAPALVHRAHRDDVIRFRRETPNGDGGGLRPVALHQDLVGRFRLLCHTRSFETHLSVVRRRFEDFHDEMLRHAAAESRRASHFQGGCRVIAYLLREKDLFRFPLAFDS